METDQPIYRCITYICFFFVLYPSFSVADNVDNYLLCEMKKLQIPGLSVAIVKNGKLVKSKGYGLSNIETGSLAKPETLYQSGSLGKQFTAALTMILVEKGLLNLDEPINHYIKGAPPRWKDITTRHLLTHTSGLTRYNPETDMRLDYTDNELIQKLMPYPLDFLPGTAFKYSNTGYQFLGFIMKKATGKSYDSLLQTYIFKPLDMKTARVIGNRDDIVVNRADRYDFIDGKLKNEDYASRTFNSTADGALYFSVLDLAKWDKALYSTKLLTTKSKNLMWSPVKLKDGKTENYGFGWFLNNINGHRIFEHGGERSGFTAFISRYIDDKLTVIILSNLSGNEELGAITHHVAEIYNNKLAAQASSISSTPLDNCW